MYEPHLLDYASSSHHRTASSASNGYAAGEGASILEELDKITPANLKAFDAFPKVESTYVSHSQRGGILTALVSSLIFLLVLNDLGEFLYGAPEYRFEVDHGVERELQVNVDLTVAMPCQYLRDAVGDRLHLSDAFQKEGTTFAIGKASSSALQPTQASPHSIISSASRRTPSQQSSSSSFFGGFFGGITRLLTFGVFGRPNGRGRTQYTAFRPTVPLVEGGEACRLYGSVMVKKATGNLHVTTLGHGYMSWEHTDHTLMNLTHVIHEFSFGPFFPAISQPLDMSYELTEKPFAAFQYFLRVIPTTYISASRQILRTSQYAVTASSRSFEHGKGVPGLFFKYDLDGMSLTVRERTTSLYHFLIRLAGVVGGVWTVASFGLRVFNRAQKVVTGKEVKGGEGWERPSLLPRSSSGMGMAGGMAGGNVPAQGLVRRPAGGDVLFDYKEK